MQMQFPHLVVQQSKKATSLAADGGGASGRDITQLSANSSTALPTPTAKKRQQKPEINPTVGM